MPKRIQRKRTKGWKMPEGAVYVGRGTKWGNPFKGHWAATQYQAAFPTLIDPKTGFLLSLALDELRGKNLACWCAHHDEEGRPVACHADFLLRIANG